MIQPKLGMEQGASIRAWAQPELS